VKVAFVLMIVMAQMLVLLVFVSITIEMVGTAIQLIVCVVVMAPMLHVRQMQIAAVIFVLMELVHVIQLVVLVQMIVLAQVVLVRVANVVVVVVDS